MQETPLSCLAGTGFAAVAAAQRWAAALHAAGYHGVQYWTRHDLAHVHTCMTLFGTVSA